MSRTEHPVWENELMPYADGELDALQASALVEHLEDCEKCKGLVSDVNTISKLIAAWNAEESPRRMKERILAELRARRRRLPRLFEKWESRSRVWIYGLSGVVLAVLLVVLISIPKQTTIAEFTAALGGFETEQDSQQVATSSAGGFPVGQAQRGQGQQGQGQQQQVFARTFRQNRETAQTLQPQVPTETPMIIRTARIVLVSRDFDQARSRIEGIVAQSRGYLGDLSVRGQTGAARHLSAALHLQADRLDSVVVELRKVGTVLEESQKGSDVTGQYVDLQARLSNAHNTEQRLVNLLRERTGRLSDVLEAEREIARVREEIERMEAQEKDLANRVRLATIQIELSEEYRAAVEPLTPTAGTRLRNASIEGYKGAVESVLQFMLLVLRYGPPLLLWAVIAIPVVVVVWRKYRTQ